MIPMVSKAAKYMCDKRILGAYGLTCPTKVPPTPVDLFGLSPYAVLERGRRSVKSLEDDLHAWMADVGNEPADPRIRVGTMTMWHMCFIIVRHYLFGMSMEEAGVQLSARTILELCMEAGDRPQFLSWVNRTRKVCQYQNADCSLC